MKKFECRGCVNHCVVTTNDDYCHVLCHLVCEDWHEVKEAVTNCSQPPKLTTEVFNRPDCPTWAKYAALGAGGVLNFYEDKPMMSKDEYPKRWINYDRWYPVEGVKFDASDWQNSLVERPAEELPEWCKVGRHGFDNGQKRYFEIVHIDEKWVDIEYLDDGTSETACRSDMFKCLEARKRQFNKKEMESLIGKIIKDKIGNICQITNYFSVRKEIVAFLEFYNAEKLMKSDYTINGKPCYVLEHKNDKGEWVE